MTRDTANLVGNACAARDEQRVVVAQAVRWYIGTHARISARRRGRPQNCALLDRHAHHEGTLRGALFRERELDVEVDRAFDRAYAETTGRAA